MSHEPEARSFVPPSKRCVARFRYSDSPFYGISRCRFLASIRHDVHVGVCVGLLSNASVWWRPETDSVIVRTYKPYYDYVSFPPGNWLLANFDKRECSGNAGITCDSCKRCKKFAAWRHENGVDEYDSALDIPGLTPGDSRIDQNRLGESICGLCGGFVGQRLTIEPDELKKPRIDLANPRARWLASLASEHTREYYGEIFDSFFDWAISQKHYSLLPSVDPSVWLVDHRRLEIKTENTRLHCEMVVRDWCVSLKDGGLDPSSVTTYRHVVSSFFHHAFLHSRGRLHLPKGGGS